MGKKVIISGATGMVGGEVLKLILEDDTVDKVISLARRKSNHTHPKLEHIIPENFLNYKPYKDSLRNVDAVLYCLGAYTGAVPKDEFRQITVDYPKELVKELIKISPNTKFCLLSGAGADRSEKSRMQFARDKGTIENFISASNLEFYTFRPGYIYPVEPRKEPNFMYRLSRFLYPIIQLFGKNASIKSTQLARAMVNVALKGADKEILENRDILKQL